MHDECVHATPKGGDRLQTFLPVSYFNHSYEKYSNFEIGVGKERSRTDLN